MKIIRLVEDINGKNNAWWFSTGEKFNMQIAGVDGGRPGRSQPVSVYVNVGGMNFNFTYPSIGEAQAAAMYIAERMNAGDEVIALSQVPKII